MQHTVPPSQVRAVPYRLHMVAELLPCYLAFAPESPSVALSTNSNWLDNRTLYLLRQSVFVVNSALCALAWSGPSLIALRIMQGPGGRPILPMRP
jgi:hypothetical protein